MKKLFVAGIIAVTSSLMLVSCSDESNAIRTLKNQGYTDIKITGINFLSCGREDIYRTGFEAKSQAGIEVSGTVCKGVFKGNTIRLD